MDQTQTEAILRRFAAAEATDEPHALFEAALALALLESPGQSPDAGRRLMQDLLADALPAAESAVTAQARAMLLSLCIAQKTGFSGDRTSYDFPGNANLISVIARKKGLPVTLSILYIELARRLGWTAFGLNFPGHFLVRVDGLTDRAVLDPFNDGALLTSAGMRHLLKSIAGETAELKPDHYAPASDRALLLRLQNNIKIRLLKGGDFPGAIATLRRMLLIAPHEAEVWYELGILEIHRGARDEARAALEKCLSSLDIMQGPADLRARAQQSLRELAARMT